MAASTPALQSLLSRSRYKPYARAQHSRILVNRRGEEFALGIEISEDEQPQGTEEICNKTWRLHKASPLYNFKYEEARNYSNALSAHIESAKHKGVGFLMNSAHTYKVVISKLAGLRTSEENSDAVQIAVSVKTPSGVMKIIFTGVLLCCTGGNTFEKLKHPKFTVFPILLTRGPEAIRNSVVSYLRDKFDCYISPFCLCPYELEWIFSMWPVANNGQGAQASPELLYATSNKDLSSIRVSMDKDSIMKIWSSVHDVNSNEIHSDEKKMFMKRMEQFYKERLSINVAAMQLTAVKTPVLLASNKGKLKILRKEYVRRILQHMTTLSLALYAFL